jgi:hypothetical protein
MIVVLANGAHFTIGYFTDLACIATFFASFNEFFIAMITEVQMIEIVFGELGNQGGSNKKRFSTFFGSCGRRHDVRRIA